jgi:hypothetical protein
METKISKTGQPEHESQERTAMTGLTEEIQNIKPEQGSLGRAARASQPEQ